VRRDATAVTELVTFLATAPVLEDSDQDPVLEDALAPHGDLIRDHPADPSRDHRDLVASRRIIVDETRVADPCPVKSVAEVRIAREIVVDAAEAMIMTSLEVLNRKEDAVIAPDLTVEVVMKAQK